MADYEELQTLLEYRFSDLNLLRLALTHPSVAHEQGTPMQTNQRLEFLGDAVLQLVLTTELYKRFPEFGEGPLTKARAKLVNRRTLAEQARRLDLGRHLIVSRGEDLSGGRDRPSALADTFEAVVGAVYLDGGFAAVSPLIQREFRPAFDGIIGIPALENPKGELQELLQSFSSRAPSYYVASTTGPDHDRVFECIVQHEGKELARGRGKSKKEAESDAALAALERLRSESPANAAATPAPEDTAPSPKNHS